ncbi:mafG [Caudoviricetes sp.]|nr:mafG [Caudoviricetes sp.]
MKTFTQYTDQELLSISVQDLNDAIRREAIERGIKPPMPLSEALRTSEWRGYQLPAENAAVWEINKLDGYSKSGIAYLTEELATKALEGLVSVEHGYGNQAPKLKTGCFGIIKVFISVSPSESKAEKFEEYYQDDTKFNDVRDECLKRLGEVRQADYNRRVNAEKKAEYLRLAGGNEDVAKAFWAKVEGGEWPQ